MSRVPFADVQNVNMMTEDSSQSDMISEDVSLQFCEDEEVFFGEVTEHERYVAEKIGKRRTVLFIPGFRRPKLLDQEHSEENEKENDVNLRFNRAEMDRDSLDTCTSRDSSLATDNSRDSSLSSVVTRDSLNTISSHRMSSMSQMSEFNNAQYLDSGIDSSKSFSDDSLMSQSARSSEGGSVPAFVIMPVHRITTEQTSPQAEHCNDIVHVSEPEVNLAEEVMDQCDVLTEALPLLKVSSSAQSVVPVSRSSSETVEQLPNVMQEVTNILSDVEVLQNVDLVMDVPLEMIVDEHVQISDNTEQDCMPDVNDDKSNLTSCLKEPESPNMSDRGHDTASEYINHINTDDVQIIGNGDNQDTSCSIQSKKTDKNTGQDIACSIDNTQQSITSDTVMEEGDVEEVSVNSDISETAQADIFNLKEEKTIDLVSLMNLPKTFDESLEQKKARLVLLRKQKEILQKQIGEGGRVYPKSPVPKPRPQEGSYSSLPRVLPKSGCTGRPALVLNEKELDAVTKLHTIRNGSSKPKTKYIEKPVTLKTAVIKHDVKPRKLQWNNELITANDVRHTPTNPKRHEKPILAKKSSRFASSVGASPSYARNTMSSLSRNGVSPSPSSLSAVQPNNGAQGPRGATPLRNGASPGFVYPRHGAIPSPVVISQLRKTNTLADMASKEEL